MCIKAQCVLAMGWERDERDGSKCFDPQQRVRAPTLGSVGRLSNPTRGSPQLEARASLWQL